MNPGYRKRTIILLVVLLVVRFWLGQTFELSGREAYLWLEGHGVNLSPGYWERGPLVPLLIRIGTLFFGDTELGVRWPAAMIVCLTGFTLFYLARHWFNARAAFWTVVLFVVLPMFAWKLSFMTEATASVGLMALAMLGFCRATEEDKLGWWLLGGAACGLAMLVSIANAWWLVGLLLYFVLEPDRRPRLREPLLWTMLIFSSLFLAPIIWWWHGPQVADIRRSRLINDWPLSHPFSFSQGWHFIVLEAFQLSPLFVVGLVMALFRLKRDVFQDARFGLLISLALPGLLWETFASFFSEGNFELVPALFLPLLLLAGCCADRVIPDARRRDLAWAAIFVLAALQTLAGLGSIYSANHRSWIRGEALAGLAGGAERSSWRNLADQMMQMQREVGANLIITDSPASASALSFYLPHHPSIYVVQKSDDVTQFDFWPQYTDAASPNDSALFITRSTDGTAPSELARNFSSVTPLPDMPLPDFDRSWNLWNCQRFTGASQPAGAAETGPVHETDALPK